jgi:hypothetical protein
MRTERDEPESRLGRERPHGDGAAVVEIDVDPRGGAVLGGECFDPQVDPLDELVQRPGHARPPKLGH